MLQEQELPSQESNKAQFPKQAQQEIKPGRSLKQRKYIFGLRKMKLTSVTILPWSQSHLLLRRFRLQLDRGQQHLRLLTDRKPALLSSLRQAPSWILLDQEWTTSTKIKSSRKNNKERYRLRGMLVGLLHQQPWRLQTKNFLRPHSPTHSQQ